MGDNIEYQGEILGTLHFNKKGFMLVTDGIKSLDRLLNILPSNMIYINGEERRYFDFKRNIFDKLKGLYLSEEDYIKSNSNN